MEFNFRTKKDCQFDAVSLGEVMLRFDPGEGRIRTARTFRVWEGGGEYNVARGLRRCFGMNTAIITAFADNEAGFNSTGRRRYFFDPVEKNRWNRAKLQEWD